MDFNGEIAKLSDEEKISIIFDELHSKETLTDEDIKERAYRKIKSMKHILPNKFFHYRNKNKKIIFMAGSPGAGKSETAQLLLSKDLEIDIIDTDEIIKELNSDGGKNSHLYQKASSKGVSILTDYAFKNNLSFILDGNFAEYNLQKKNIERALKHGYEIKIVFVNRNINDAKRFTRIREENSGRHEPDDIFIRKSFGCIETVKKFLPTIEVSFYDLSNRSIIENICENDFDLHTKANLEILDSMNERRGL
ncbi:zeta toxin family protein [Sulfurimonas sp. SAG-AH-194-I05]|nr:zeta toxin family protein [Sulfurimonas sp. SAG-AH-194-I05]MDF1876174.1 zeta toxin family protein [Sulfurimonas sp. SAG-AH-194-I05]